MRALASAVVHRTWRWLSTVGGVASSDRSAKRFRSMGESSFIAFPPGAVFGERWIEIGAHTLVGPNVSLSAGLPGETNLNEGAVVSIGNGCNIGRGSSINGRGKIVVEDDVTTGPYVYITDHNHTYADVTLPIKQQWVSWLPVRVGEGSWLGANVVVLPGADIGRHVTVAAGSVVRGTIPDFSVAAGAPAKVVRQYDPDRGWDPPVGHVDPAPEGWFDDAPGYDGMRAAHDFND